MPDKLQRIFEYRVLLSRARELGIPLSDDEAAHLDLLGQELPSGVPPIDERDAHTVLPQPVPVEIVHAGRFQACTLRNAASGGLALVTAVPPQLGQRVLVHVRNPKRPVEYTFPARVVSRVVRGVCGMSVAFEGLPSQRALGGRTSGVFATDEATPTQVHHRPERRRR
jgi:hypothetical protein